MMIITSGLMFRPRTHRNFFLRFCIVYCSQGNREQPAHYLKQYKRLLYTMSHSSPGYPPKNVMYFECLQGTVYTVF